MAKSLSEVRAQYERLKARDSEHQSKMRDVLLVRDGKMNQVFPDLFPSGPYSDGIVANMVDVAARDLSEMIAPLPSFNCASATMTADSARKFAEKRTKIANGYVLHSKLQRQMFDAADHYLSYGFVIGMVELDQKANLPRIKFHDSIGSYVLRDQWNDCIAVFMSEMWDRDSLIAAYPAVEGHLRSNAYGANTIEVVRYHDADTDMLFQSSGMGFTLTAANNPAKRCLAAVIERPGLSKNKRGQFDDVLAVQVAKARFALLNLEAATKAVQAPLAVPNDVNEMAFGPDSILRSQFPEKIRRVGLDMSPVAFQQSASLAAELRDGSRYSDLRGGHSDASIVTGKGVMALMDGFNAQIRTAQSMFAVGLTDLIQLCFEVDAAVWPDTTRTMRGNADGVKYEVTYTPAKDIKGDYTVDVQYGLMAGLDPNRALVFGLQARGDDLISKDFLRRQLPFNINATEEEAKVDIEKLRDGLMQAVLGYGQSIPVLAEQGQDISGVLAKIATLITGRTNGEPIETLVTKAFAPAPPPEADPQGGVETDGAPAAGGPGGGPPGSIPSGLQPSGLPDGVAPGQAGLPPGGRPDVQNLLAGLTGRGTPNLSASIQRRQAI
jgi:hypothetical protein